MNTTDLIGALQLGQSIIRRTDAQPLPLSNEQTHFLARALLHAAAKPHEREMPPVPEHLSYLTHIPEVFSQDIDHVITTDIGYNGSWQQRGGCGAFFVLARKWDRLEPRVSAFGYDIFAAIAGDRRREGVIDDIRDLRRYLGLAEAWAINRQLVPSTQTSKEDTT